MRRKPRRCEALMCGENGGRVLPMMLKLPDEGFLLKVTVHLCDSHLRQAKEDPDSVEIDVDRVETRLT